MKQIKVLLLLAITIMFSSCEKDFSTVGDYQDVTVVYALLDQHQGVQYVKINKAFLGEGDALIMAKEPDSTNYPYKLDVRIDEYNAAGTYKIRTIEFDTTTIYNKEPGIFYYPNQPIYKSLPFQWDEIICMVNPQGDTIDYDTLWLNDEHLYKLVIEFPDTTKTITSETFLVADFSITKPGYSKTIKFTNDPNSQTTIQWNKPTGAQPSDALYKYELSMTLNYRELSLGQDTISKSLTFIKTNLTPNQNLSEITYYYSDQYFFNTCASQIPYSDPEKEAKVVGRYSQNIVISVAVASQDFTLYLEVYEPSTSIVQVKPQYTNIENGLGIFSSRYLKTKVKKLHTESLAELNNMGLKFEY